MADRNTIPKRGYNRINIAILWGERQEMGYSTPVWLRQANGILAPRYAGASSGRMSFLCLAYGRKVLTTPITSGYMAKDGLRCSRTEVVVGCTAAPVRRRHLTATKTVSEVSVAQKKEPHKEA